MLRWFCALIARKSVKIAQKRAVFAPKIGDFVPIFPPRRGRNNSIFSPKKLPIPYLVAPFFRGSASCGFGAFRSVGRFAGGRAAAFRLFCLFSVY